MILLHNHSLFKNNLLKFKMFIFYAQRPHLILLYLVLKPEKNPIVTVLHYEFLVRIFSVQTTSVERSLSLDLLHGSLSHSCVVEDVHVLPLNWKSLASYWTCMRWKGAPAWRFWHYTSGESLLSPQHLDLKPPFSSNSGSTLILLKFCRHKLSSAVVSI